MNCNTAKVVEPITKGRRIPLSEPVFGGNEWKYVKDCLDSGWVSSAGNYVDLFEKKIAEYTGAKYAVSTVNGTAAIHTALMVAGVGKGDRVVVPTLTFIATVNPVIYCEGIPVFVDSERETFNIDPLKAVKTIKQLVKNNQKPKAIIVTHLYGHPCDINPILDIAREYGIVVIEDACESLGSKYKGKMTGTLGDIGCLSFNGNKIITTGGGGMLLTDDQYYEKKAKYLTTQARDREIEYVHGQIGYNYRMTNIQAALGLAQIEQLGPILKKKREIAEYYHKYLQEVPGINFLCEQPWAESNFWLNTVLVEENQSIVDKASLMNKLSELGVETRPIFKPIHLQHCYRRYRHKDLEVAEKVYNRGFNLPSSTKMTEENIRAVTEALKAIFLTDWRTGPLGLEDRFAEGSALRALRM